MRDVEMFTSVRTWTFDGGFGFATKQTQKPVEVMHSHRVLNASFPNSKAEIIPKSLEYSSSVSDRSDPRAFFTSTHTVKST